MSVYSVHIKYHVPNQAQIVGKKNLKTKCYKQVNHEIKLKRITFSMNPPK